MKCTNLVNYTELGNNSLEPRFAGNSRNHFSVNRVTGDTVNRVTGDTVTRLIALLVTWRLCRCLPVGQTKAQRNEYTLSPTNHHVTGDAVNRRVH